MGMLETLESRVLMSATPGQVSAAVSAVHTHELALVADQKKLIAEITSGSKAVGGDVAKAGLAKADKALLGSASSVGKNLLAAFGKDFHTYAPVVLHEAKKLGTDGKLLLKKPTNMALSAKVSADIAAMTATDTAAIKAFGVAGDWSSFNTALQAVAQSDLPNATLSNDINKVMNTLSTQLHTTDLDVATLFLRDLISLEILFET